MYDKKRDNRIRSTSVIHRLSKVALAALFTMGGAAQAADNPWYVGASVLQAEIGDVDTISTNAVGGALRSLDIEGDDDTGFEVKIGKVVKTAANGNELSLELSYSEFDNDLDTLNFNSNNFSARARTAAGELEVETLLARVVYKFETGAIDPYFGVGVGSTDLELNAVYGGSVNSSTGSQPPFAQGDDNSFTYQLRAGLEWDVSEQFGLFLEYSYTDIDEIEFNRTGGGPGGLTTTTQDGDFNIEAINFGLNFRF